MGGAPGTRNRSCVFPRLKIETWGARIHVVYFRSLPLYLLDISVVGFHPRCS